MDPVDLLVFGPHPDDLEIGLGGTIAKHAARGQRVGLCDLTAGEMGSNGTVDERLAEAESARGVLGAAWRVNFRLPDRAIGRDPEHTRVAAALIRQVRPRAIAVPYGVDRHPDHVAASQMLTEAVFNAGLRRYDTGAPVGSNRGVAGALEPWRPQWICYYFINDSAAPSFLIDVSDHYDVKRRALECHVSQFRAEATGSVRTRLTSPLFQQLVESRDAQFGALAGVGFAEGIVVNEPVVRSDLFKL